jgi:hypothetical protein
MSRHDLYGPVHRGLRKALCGLLVRLGQTDFANAAAAAEMLAALRQQLVLSAKHLYHEDVEIHGALEARAPGSTASLESAHNHHRAGFSALEAFMQSIEAAEPEERHNLGRALYLRFSQFVAEDFLHMAEEATVTLPLLHELFSDAELIAIHKRIVGALAPEMAIAFMQLIIPALGRDERVEFLSFARASAPPDAFDAILNFAARPALAPAEFARLTQGLGLAA